MTQACRWLAYIALSLIAGALANSPAAAAHFAPSALLQICTFDSEVDRANCDAFYRGSIERFEARAELSRTPCRRTPITREDINAFVAYSKAHMIPESGEGFALVVRYITSPGGLGEHIPCRDVLGFWSTEHYLDLCTQSITGSSPCKFYQLPLLQIASIEPALTGKPIFCPTGDPVRADQDILKKFRDWLSAHPDKRNEPAALGFIEAMQESYPCSR